MGIRLVVEVLDHYHGPSKRKLWLLSFAEQANDRTRQGWPARRLLADRAGVSEARASNIATELVAEGVIKRVGGGGKNRGPAQYEMAALSQGSPSTNSESQGSVSGPQGSVSPSQGSDPWAVPAETPGLNPSVSTPLSSSPLIGPKAAGLPTGPRQNPRGRERPSRAKIINDTRTAISLVYGDRENVITEDEQVLDLWGYLIGARFATVPHPVAYLEKIFCDTPDIDTLLIGAVGSEEAADGLDAVGLGVFGQTA
jgi:hypothetical protein